MKKIFATLFSILICFVMMLGLCSCNLVEINRKDYYSQIVATAGDLEFTKLELINEFYNTGYSYYQQGYTIAQSVEIAKNAMIQRALLVEKIKEVIDITPYESEIRYNAFKAMQDSIDTLEEEVRDERGIKNDFPDEEEATSTRAQKEEYETKFNYTYNTTTRKYELTRKIADREVFDKTVSAHFVQKISETDISAEAYSRYIKTLQSSAKNEGRSTTEADVLKYEEERLIKVYTQNMYLELYEAQFMKDLPIDTDAVVNYYKEQYLAQYADYSNTVANYDTAMKSRNSTYVFYNPVESDGYVYVNHILVSFSDEQKAEIAILDTKLSNKLISKADYDKAVALITSKTTTTYVENGEEIEGVTVNEVFNRVKNYVGSANNIVDKAKRFEEMMYLFNDDTGNMNTDFYYAIPLDESVSSSYAESFVAGARDLYNNYSQGDVYYKLVQTTYGYHIMFYMDSATNLVSKNNISNITYETLMNTTVNPSSDKTLFEYFYDLLKLDEQDDSKYTEHTQNLVNEALNEYQVTVYSYKYSDILNG